jgi:hypothetical protein
MSEPKLTKFEIFKAVVVLLGVVTIYVAVSQFVLNTFWNLVLKLLDKATSE